MNKIAIFASGSGSNAESIIRYFSGNKEVEVVLVLSNKKDAYVLERAKKHQIPTLSFSRNDLNNTSLIIDALKECNASIVILAGFLLKIPQTLIEAYPKAIVNIHPALLPKYGGKGMYGMNVHRAVVANEEKESGITIHYVNEQYDEGAVIFQASCKLQATESPEQVQEKVQALEAAYFPKIIESIL